VIAHDLTLPVNMLLLSRTTHRCTYTLCILFPFPAIAAFRGM
jgi:hypothetical protein